MLLDLERRLWKVEEYHAMAEAGILDEDDRVELIEGEIIAMSPIGVRHMAAINRLNYKLGRRFRDKAVVSVQNAIRLDDQSEPVPDIVLLPYRDDFYADEMPTADDVLLLTEVSDSTLPYDRRVKRPLYARAGVPEYWLVNLVDNTIEVHRRPENGTYTEVFTRYRNELIAAVAFPDQEFKVSELVG